MGVENAYLIDRKASDFRFCFNVINVAVSGIIEKENLFVINRAVLTAVHCHYVCCLKFRLRKFKILAGFINPDSGFFNRIHGKIRDGVFPENDFHIFRFRIIFDYILRIKPVGDEISGFVRVSVSEVIEIFVIRKISHRIAFSDSNSNVILNRKIADTADNLLTDEGDSAFCVNRTHFPDYRSVLRIVKTDSGIRDHINGHFSVFSAPERNAEINSFRIADKHFFGGNSLPAQKEVCGKVRFSVAEIVIILIIHKIRKAVSAVEGYSGIIRNSEIPPVPYNVRIILFDSGGRGDGALFPENLAGISFLRLRRFPFGKTYLLADFLQFKRNGWNRTGKRHIYCKYKSHQPFKRFHPLCPPIV